MSEYKLSKRIIGQSISDSWDRAKSEWKLDRVYENPGESCLCGHNPITEVCVLLNILNNNRAEVGNCCVQKFMGISSQKVFSSIKRIKANEENSANADLIDMAKEKKWISEKEYVFYIDVWRKRITTLSLRQKNWKIILNRKIIKGYSIL